MAGGDAEQRAEGGVARAAAVEAKDEFVEVGLEMPAAQAVIDAQSPDPGLRRGRHLRLAKIRCTQGNTTWAAILPMTWGSWLTPGAPG